MATTTPSSSEAPHLAALATVNELLDCAIRHDAQGNDIGWLRVDDLTPQERAEALDLCISLEARLASLQAMASQAAAGAV